MMLEFWFVVASLKSICLEKIMKGGGHNTKEEQYTFVQYYSIWSENVIRARFELLVSAPLPLSSFLGYDNSQWRRK
jgi:hypothetical protein